MAFSAPFGRVFAPPFGPALAAAATAPVTRVYDTFTAADGTAISGRTPDIAPAGVTWSQLSGTWTISSNRAKIGASDYAHIVANSGVADCVITADIPVMTIGGVNARMSASTNGWVVLLRNDAPYESMRLYEMDGSTYTQRAADENNPTEGGTVTMTLSGASITVAYQTLSLTYALATRNQTVTNHGMFAYTDENRIDNFKVVG